MPAIDPHLWNLITRYSRVYHLDPRAVAAVSIMEGGGRFGAVGDSGTSFGPWQLHVGGALPPGKNARWANSPQGVSYALRKMSESGARGLHGQAAIASIVRNFERPANPGAEIAGAIGHYSRLRGLRAPAGGMAGGARGSTQGMMQQLKLQLPQQQVAWQSPQQTLQTQPSPLQQVMQTLPSGADQLAGQLAHFADLKSKLMA